MCKRNTRRSPGSEVSGRTLAREPMKKSMLLIILLLALLIPMAAGAASPEIPAYGGKTVIELNDNVPGFEPEELRGEDFVRYSELDALGRSGQAVACVSRKALPTELRGEIRSALPSGWEEVRYDGVIDGSYLYARCHLISYDLGGENDDVRNFLTGTRFFKQEGLRPYEEKVARYLQRSANHVLYRVTPVYDGDALVAKGVQMEACSVEDSGKTVSFNVFVYNVQPGVIIDYTSGKSERDPDYVTPEEAAAAEAAAAQTAASSETAATPAPTSTRRPLISLEALESTGAGPKDIPLGTTYVFDHKTFLFHTPTCPAVDDIYNMNVEYFTGTRDEAIIRGYNPCSRCSP